MTRPTPALPVSRRLAPRETSWATSSFRSVWVATTSKCSRFILVLGATGCTRSTVCYCAREAGQAQGVVCREALREESKRHEASLHQIAGAGNYGGIRRGAGVKVTLQPADGRAGRERRELYIRSAAQSRCLLHWFDEPARGPWSFPGQRPLSQATGALTSRRPRVDNGQRSPAGRQSNRRSLDSR
jgi:hypothetical protein